MRREESRTIDQMLAIRVVRLEATVQGVVVGLMVGLTVFLATNWLMLRGGPVVGPHLVLLGQFFLGYEVSFAGSLVGFAWGAAYGFVAGYAVSALYNRLVARAAAARRS